MATPSDTGNGTLQRLIEQRPRSTAQCAIETQALRKPTRARTYTHAPASLCLHKLTHGTRTQIYIYIYIDLNKVDSHTHTHARACAQRQTDRQTDRQAGRQADRQAGRDARIYPSIHPHLPNHTGMYMHIQFTTGCLGVVCCC